MKSPDVMLRRTRRLDGIAVTAIPLTELVEAGSPVILPGAARDWPLVQAACNSDAAIGAMLRDADADLPVVAYVGDPSICGRFHYDASGTAMNFARERGTLRAFLDRLLAPGDDARSLYVGSTDLDTHLPGMRASNPIIASDGVFTAHPPTASIWIGNRTVAATHWDMANNLAVCVAGRRRFMLFPPDQVGNLYPGPIDPTPAGQVVSMVDPAAPDFDRYPNFAAALAAAEIAELEPGDILIYPALWWHQVEALAPFNVLVNYWWNAAPAYLDPPMTTLLHGLLSLRGRPDHEKQAWRAIFDHYLFATQDQASAHLPTTAQGPLGPLDPLMARRLRSLIANRLNR